MPAVSISPHARQQNALMSILSLLLLTQTASNSFAFLHLKKKKCSVYFFPTQTKSTITLPLSKSNYVITNKDKTFPFEEVAEGLPCKDSLYYNY